MSNSKDGTFNAVAMSRRKLLRNGCAMAAGAVLFGAGGSLASEKAPSVRSELPTTKWDAEFDVLVIGSGFAALSAAIEARRKGLDVMVVEKMRVLGGN